MKSLTSNQFVKTDLNFELLNNVNIIFTLLRSKLKGNLRNVVLRILNPETPFTNQKTLIKKHISLHIRELEAFNKWKSRLNRHLLKRKVYNFTFLSHLVKRNYIKCELQMKLLLKGLKGRYSSG